MFFRRKSNSIYHNASIFDNNDFAKMIIQTINSYPEIVSIEIGIGEITINPKNILGETFSYIGHGYNYMTFE